MSHGLNVLALCRVTNFETARRILGKNGLHLAAEALATRIVADAPDVQLIGVGRDLIEFQIACPDRAGAGACLQALRHALDALQRDVLPEVRLEFAIGAACASVEERDTLRLLEVAEIALERAGDAGGYEVIDLSLADRAVDRLTLIADLPRAIAAGEMFLHYQPKINVRQQQVSSAEALIRWQHPERGLIMPGDFIAAAEESGLIGPLTLWTLRQVIADQRRLASLGHDIPLFLNISGMLLANAGFIDEVCEIITANASAKLGFEITETAVIRDPESAIRHLQRFADHGVVLAIDDYGAGLSSLAYLKQLPAKELKIDKMFITQLTSSHRDPLIVRSTIDLAHALEMEVTAEGVETPAALALLSVMGCDLVQGYLISRPVPLPALCSYLGEQDQLAETMASRPVFLRSGSSWTRA
ncbi:EAL domain-containing protein [Sphingomonas sp.]|uniref:putative bifunctional diguanylate cyclase/phosphodiesterase n=1 Tax=Sphingomonas sp. TaxID=28214 RepID=UPI0028AD5CA3|nr:EAL domain-containing protein [Sphingomonas sp.]